MLLDTSAWIEYLEGSKLGEKVRAIILNQEEVMSLNITISEVVSKIKRKGGNTELAFNIINSNSKIISITPEIAKKAGLLHAETRKEIPNFGLVDSILLILARDLGAKILTGDEHFRKFKEAVFIN